MRPRKCAVLCSPVTDALPRHVHLRGRVDDVGSASSSHAPRVHQLARNGDRRCGRRLMTYAVGHVCARVHLQPVLAAVDGLQRCVGSWPGGPSKTILPPGHADDAVGEALRQLDVVHVDDHRDAALAGDVGEQLHDLDRGLRVERRRRLVGEQQRRLLHHGARDARRAGAGRRTANPRAGGRNPTSRPRRAARTRARCPPAENLRRHARHAET